VFKICRSCGQEFQMWASECSDCHVPLHLTPGEELAPPEARPQPARDDLVQLKLGGAWELQALAEELQQRGISSRIDTPPGESGRGSPAAAAQLAIYVSRADLAAVREFTEELAARELAEAGIAEVEHDPNACPACGEPTPENAASCASCGLEFPEVPEHG
jgi:predicted amidophosphoribosyltransferase